MKKIIFLFAAINLNSVIGQTIDIPLIVIDGISIFNLLKPGADSTATQGIDPHPGEFICQ